MSTTATIILTDTIKNSSTLSFDTVFDGKTVLEHALVRSQIIESDIFIVVDDLNEEAIMRNSVSDDLLQNVKFLLKDTSLTNKSPKLKSIFTVIKNLTHNYAIFHDLCYLLLNSLDLMRLYQYLTEKPLELITFMSPKNHLTETLFGINLELTKTRQEEIFNLNDHRLSSFYRSSLNTGIFPIVSDTHRMECFTEDKDLLQSAPIDELSTSFKDFIIIRPGKHYRAFQRLKNKKMIENDKLSLLLKLEQDKWEEIEPIITHNQSDGKIY